MARTASVTEGIDNVLMKSKETVDEGSRLVPGQGTGEITISSTSGNICGFPGQEAGVATISSISGNNGGFPGQETGVVTVSSISGNNSGQITRQFPDIVDIDRVVLNSSQLINSLNDITRMRERHSSNTSSGNVQQAGDRGMSPSPPHNDTTRNNLEQSVTTPTDQSRRSESPAIDYRTIDNRTRSSPTQSAPNTDRTRSSPTQLAPNTDLSSPRPIQTQDLNAGVVSRMDSRHEALPDLLHSHVIPSQVPSSRHNPHRPPPGHMVDPRGGHHHQSHVRHHPRSHRDRHRSHHHHRSRRRSRSNSQSDNEPCKDSCLKCLAATTSFRWILVILSLLGVCCVVTGIVLAALHAAGNSFLFLAIMFIGLGVLLVVVVAVGWKCTPRGHEPLHALFSLGDFRRQRGTTRRQHRQHGGHRNREGHWYGGVLYPEFQYRRPPPSYNASMQDYQTQLALAQSHREFYNDEDLPAEDYSLPSSPPPSYRSRASTVRTGIHIQFPNGDQYPNSRPPTYRSHISTSRSQAHPRPSLPRDETSGEIEGQGGDIAFNGPESVSNTHSRNNSLTVNNVNPGAVTINIINSSNTSTPLDVERVQQILHSRQPSGSAINNDNVPIENSTTEGLDQDIQQTLQTLDNATSSANAESRTNETGSSENTTQNPVPNDDDYPMLTSL